MMLFFPIASLLLLQIIPAIALLSPRQSNPDIGPLPAACAGNCTGPLTNLENCLNSKNATCLCNQPLEASVFNCFLCLGNLAGNFSTGQEIINEIVTTCDGVGLTISPLVFSGQSFTSTAPPLPTSSIAGGLTLALPSSGNATSGVSSPQTTMTLQTVNTPQPTASPTGPMNGARPSSNFDRTAAIFWVIAPTLLTMSLFIVQ